MVERCLRVMPSAAAAFVTLAPSGAMYNSRNTSPGCAGLCILELFLVSAIVAIVHLVDVFPFKAENHAKVFININCPTALRLSLERMKSQPRRIHLARVRGCI